MGSRSRGSLDRGSLGRGAGGARRAGQVPVWVPLALLFSLLFMGLLALQRDAKIEGVARIDATRYRLQAGSRWLSPAWRAQLEALLIDVRELSANEPDGIRAFVARIAELPFVAEVGEPEVQWPDGLTVPLRLQEPVACVPSGTRDFLPVAADGTVLGGYSFAPHEAYGGWLPALALPPGVSLATRPGDVLEGAALRDALRVADSMWRYLDVPERRRLGRILIDARAPDAPVFDREPGSLSPPVLPGGVILALEDGRRVYFGRAPLPTGDGGVESSPGELPLGLKWRGVGEALSSDGGDGAWRLLDVRFDTPVRLNRAEVEAFAERGIVDLDTYVDPFEPR